MLKLKLQYFGHLMWRVDSLEKTLMLGGIGGRRRRGWQRMRWLDGITDSMDVSLSELRSWWWTGRPGVLRFMGSQRVGHDWATELNWTEFDLTSLKVIVIASLLLKSLKTLNYLKFLLHLFLFYAPLSKTISGPVSYLTVASTSPLSFSVRLCLFRFIHIIACWTFFGEIYFIF